MFVGKMYLTIFIGYIHFILMLNNYFIFNLKAFHGMMDINECISTVN